MTAAASVPSRGYAALTPLGVLALLGGQLAVTVAIGLSIGPHAWDDGAITLAYSRTFAETGRIALTAASEQSEGFSSVAWFLVDAAVALARPGFEGAILSAQLLTGFFLSIALVFTWLIAQSLRLRTGTTLAILMTFAAFGPSVTETANGMEMTFLAAAGLGFCYGLYFRGSSWLTLVCGALFLLARFEAMVYFAGMIAPLLAQRKFRTFAGLCAFGLSVVGLQECARYAVFSDIVPNTIRAKAHAPYHLSGWDAFTSRLSAMLEPFWDVLPLLAVGVALVVEGRRRKPGFLNGIFHAHGAALVLLAPVAAVVGFSMLIGSNWGYTGRMQFLAFPFMFLLFGVVFDGAGDLVSRDRRPLLLVVATASTLALSWQLSAAPTFAEARADLSGSVGVTPAAYRTTGLGVDRVRRALGTETIAFLTPDVGGLGLCCSHIRVVDLGLLTNRRLARDGYGAVAAILREEKPEVIEAHQRWAHLAGLYQLPEFASNYRPALIDKARFFVRNDVFDALVAKGGRVCELRRPDCLGEARDGHRFARHVWPTDDDAFLNRDTFVEF